jgi:hypothetical protein
MLAMLMGPEEPSALFGQQGTSFTSELAKRAKSKYDDQVTSIGSEYVTRMKKAGESYAKELDEARKAALSGADLGEAQRILAAQVAARETPAAPLDSHRGLTLVTARWGVKTHWIDVTSQVLGQMKGNSISLVPGEMHLPDPLDGMEKSLIVVVIRNGKIEVACAGEGQPVEIQAD